MSTPIDLKLIGTNLDGSSVKDFFDIGIASSGDFQLEDGFDTNLIMSLFCERRAAPYEVSTPQYRRGWWGNTTSDVQGFEIGSKLWLLDQARLTTGTVRLSEQYAYEGLKWLVSDGYLAGLSVSATPTINEDTPYISLQIILTRSDNTVEYKYFSVWEATGD